MSEFHVFFERCSVRETLGSYDSNTARFVISQLQAHLSMLCASVLCDCGRIYELRMVLDGAETVFKGKFPSPECLNAIHTMTNVKELELTLRCDTSWPEAGAFGLMKTLRDLGVEDDAGVDYSCFYYYEPNLYDGGDLFRFGQNDGKPWCGIVEKKAADTLPSFGVWDTIDTPVMVEEVRCSEEAQSALISLANRLLDFDVRLYYGLEGIKDVSPITERLPSDCGLTWLSLNCATVSGEELPRFSELLGEFAQWGAANSDGENNSVCMNCKLVDISEHGPRQCELEYDEKGNCTITMTE